jgi:hypothetical protein|tara:strand:+ start:1569 stop:2084 length:516 start_codon:yes stop_codon:yes gene_type:complete
MRELNLEFLPNNMRGLSEGNRASSQSQRNIDQLKCMSEANRNNPEYAKKCSERSKGKGNGMFGKTHTPEARAKISAARKGHKTLEEIKEKRRNTMMTRYGNMCSNTPTHYFEGLSLLEWLDANRELVDHLTYKRGKRTERHKVIDLMITLCPTATKTYLSSAICVWSKKNA